MTHFFTLRNKRRHASWCVLACIVLTLLPCCTKKTHLSDLENREGVIVKKGEGVFTGKVWSSDDKTICIECELGRIKTMCFFYENGQMAMKITMKGNHFFEDDVDGEFFDKKGNPVSEDYFETEEGMEMLIKFRTYMKEMKN